MPTLKKADRDKLKDSEFAVPGKRELPIHDAIHIKLAWDMVDKTKGLTSGERATARRKILAAAKKHDIDTSDWTKKEMTDTMLAEVEVLTDGTRSATGPLKVRFKGTVTNRVNDNNRLYPDPVMTDAVERVKPKLPVIGETPHPQSKKDKNGKWFFDTKVENSVIKIFDVNKEGNQVFVDAEVLETSKGKDLKALIDQKAPVGISIRMLGNSVQRMIDNVAVDVTTFLDIHSWDIVMNPATDGCGVVEVLTDSQIEAIFEDGIQASTPACPHCSGELEPQDPDDDGDVDFLICPECKAAFVEDHEMTQMTNYSHSLRKVSPNNWDRYGQAREWLEQNGKKPMKDSNEGDGEIVNKADLMKLINEDPEVKAMLTSMAQSIAQPALDAVESQKQAEAKTKAKAEAKVFLDEQMATIKDKYDEKALKVIADSIGEPETKEMAQVLFDSAVKFASTVGAKVFADSVGFDPSNTQFNGHTRIEVGESAKPWRPIVDQICKAMDDYAEQLGHYPDPKLRAYNKKAFEKVLNRAEETVGLKALADSVQDGDLKVYKDGVMSGEVMSDAVSVTTQQLLNQPTILTAVIVQSFQDVESPQFMFTDVFEGSEWRLPIETFTSSSQYNPQTGLMDLVVAEGYGITPSAINLGWQSFSPSWRRNAVSLTTDVIRQLGSGPVKYAAIARAIYHVSEDKKRKLDNAAYLEMILASDEYAPLVIAAETPASASLVTTTGLPAGSNAGYLYKLVPGTAGYVAPTITSAVASGGNPVVRPRTVNQLQPNGQVTQVITNAVVVKVNGNPLVQGVWDGTNIQSFQGTTAQCAIDFEHGILYLMPTGGTGGSGVNPGAATPILPTISYSATTNYDRWHYTMGTGYTDIAAWYDTFLQQLTTTSKLMASSPRFKKPNLMLSSLNNAAYVQNARIFYKWASPDGTKLIDTGNTYGTRSNMNLSEINAPWVAGDNRVLLTQKGSTRYGIETPYEMEGPYPIYDSNQNIVDAKLWYGRENSVLCTPQVRDTSFNIINPVSRTIIIQP